MIKKTNSNSVAKSIEQGSSSMDYSYDDIIALQSFLKERSVYVRGAVRRPGLYPVSDGITLDNILAVAGGATLDANLDSVEITSQSYSSQDNEKDNTKTKRTLISLVKTPASSYTISAGDSVRINQKFRKLKEQTVLLVGEINHPGEYDLLSGDRVSDLLERAGGLNPQAYPSGSIFSREAERRAEELKFRATARDVERRLAETIQKENNAPDATQISLVRNLAEELSNIEAVGRITVELDPAILSTRPELDMLLEHGDRIYIPKRPLTVRVSGEVLSAANLQFIAEKDPLDYIHEAGGFTFHADKNRTFVLYPNGSAQPINVSNWNHKPIFIPPGSTIIVPRDPKPFSFLESAKEIGQILSNLAVTSVFIDDIRD